MLGGSTNRLSFASTSLPGLKGSPQPKIDKSVLTIAEPKRIRCKEHLRYVASQPCLICGRSPSHAHHLRYAQSRGLGLKVSDEFTVPLCAIHHNQIHTTGKEQEWWQQQNIDPLKVARALWQESREQHPAEKEGHPAGSSEILASSGPGLPQPDTVDPKTTPPRTSQP